MSVRPALTSQENTYLDGPSIPEWYLFIDTTAYGSEVATAQVNSPTDISFPTGDIPVDNTSAGWGNIQYNDTVFIGTTPGAWDCGIYRVRKTPGTASILRLMYVGAPDSGEVTFSLRFFPISDNMYITVLRRWDIFGVNPFINYPGSGLDAVIAEDYDNFGYQFNQYPPPRVNLFLDGQPADLGVYVRGSTSYTFDISFEITLWPNSASCSWAFTLPASWTVNSGSLTGTALTGTINVTAPHSAGTYSFAFDVTENHSSIMNCLRKVWIKSDTYPPLRIVKIGTDVDDRTGATRSITLNQLFSAPPGCRYHMVDMGSWSNHDVPTARKVFSGYLKSREEITSTGVTNVVLELVSPIYILDLIGGQSQIMTAINAAVENWQQVHYLNSYMDWVLFFLLMQRASGCVQCFNVTWFGMANTSTRMTDWRIDAGTIYSQIKGQARRYPGGNFGEDPTGEFMFRRHVSRVPFPDRSSIPVRASLTNSKYISASLGYKQRAECRRLRVEAFYSDGLTTVTPYWADGYTPASQGTTDQKEDKLIVNSIGDLTIHAGLEVAARNNPYKKGKVKIPRNYAVFYPAQMTRVDFEDAPALTYDGIEYQGYILPDKCSYTHNDDGTVELQMDFEAETYGRPGVQTEIPQPDPSKLQSRYQATSFSRVTSRRAIAQRNGNTNPAGTKNGATTLPVDGSIALGGTQKHAYLVTNILGTVAYKDITPTDIGSYDLAHGMVKIGGRSAWLLGKDSSNSVSWYTPDVYKSPKPTWTIGTPFTGIYSLIRPDDVAGSQKVLVYAPGTGNQTLFDTKVIPANTGTPTATVNTVSGQSYRVDFSGTWVVGFDGPTPLNGDAFWRQGTAGSAYNTHDVYCYINGAEYTPNPPSNPAHTYSVFVTGTGSPMTFVCFDSFYGDNSGSITATVYAVDNESVRYSSNNGSTYGATLDNQAPAGSIGGFDIQHNGTVTIAGSSGKTRKATTLGGAYADDETWGANPSLVEIPWSKRNATTLNNTGSSPEYIVGLSAADGLGNTLYWVVGGTPVDITPMISGNPGIPAGANCLCTWLGTRISYLASFAGTVHLVTSIDGGTTWVDRGAVTASYLRLRRRATQPGQLYGVGAVFKYSNTNGASLITKGLPTDPPLLFLEPIS